MSTTKIAILWEHNGKIEATLFASRKECFKLERISDQVGMIAVQVGITDKFDPKRDYLVRQVRINGRFVNQILFGTLPRWAGGPLLAGRCIIASGTDVTCLLKDHPPSGYADREVLRRNGVSFENTDDKKDQSED